MRIKLHAHAFVNTQAHAHTSIRERVEEHNFAFDFVPEIFICFAQKTIFSTATAAAADGE